MKSYFNTFKKHDQGVTAVIFALLLLPIIGVIGLSVDYSKQVWFQETLQKAADAGAHAAAMSYYNMIKKPLSSIEFDKKNIKTHERRGTEMVKLNLSSLKATVIENVTKLEINPQYYTATTVIKASISTPFMGSFGRVLGLDLGEFQSTAFSSASSSIIYN